MRPNRSDAEKSLSPGLSLRDTLSAFMAFQPSRQPLVLVAIAVSAGILADHGWGDRLTGPGFWFLLSIVAALGWMATTWLGRLPSRWSWPSSCFLLLGFAALGAAWHQLHWRWFPENHLGLHAETTRQPICLEALVLSGPRHHPAIIDPWGPPRDASSQLWIRALRARDGQHWIPVQGTGRLRVRGLLEGVLAGDTIRIDGTWHAPGTSANPGDLDYAYRLRLQRELFLVQASHPSCVRAIQPAPWWSPRRLLELTRARGRATLRTHLPEHEAHLASALLLGARELLSDDDVLPFFLTGTVHLLAISGLHLGILVFGIWLVVRLGRISERTAIVASLILVIPYALVTECRPPVVRAAVFVVVLCGGRWLSRPLAGWNTLAAAALFLLVWNPLHLFQTGVHLSFLALAGLGMAARLTVPSPADPLDRLIESSRSGIERVLRRGFLAIGRMVGASFIVWLFTFPLIASHFHVISPAGIMLNPLLWLPLAGALFTGFFLILGGLVFPSGLLSATGLGTVLGVLCSICLQTAEWLIRGVAAWKYGYFWTAAPPAWWIGGFYLILMLAALLPHHRLATRFAMTMTGIWLVAGLFLIAGPRLDANPQRLACTFFSVGHGTCVLVESPDGKTIVYDAGHLGPPQSVVRTVSRYLWSTRHRRLDLVIVSHADMDHFNAIPNLAERFRVGEVWIPPHVVRHRSPLVLRFRDHLQQCGIPTQVVHQGLITRDPSGFRLEILHPPASMRIGSDNAQSIVLQVSYAGRRLLLPGDLESPGLEFLLKTPTEPFDVVMAPHHGSPRSFPAEFIRWSRPRWVIVSSGSSPAANVVRDFRQGGAEMRETSRDGAVRVEIERDGSIRVLSWKREGW